MYSLIVLAILLAVSMAVGPSGPYLPDFACDEEGYKVVDAENMCWFSECVRDETEALFLLPRRCALGSKISYNFVEGFHNPCTINFDSVIGYDCTRNGPSVDGPPSCFNEDVRMECFNGGAPTFEANICWCNCPPSWQGDFDCSKPTLEVTDLPAGSDICVNGEPQADWCNLEGGGCLNGGTCFNQCDTFWCDCPDHENNDYYGKRCELQ